MEQVDLTVQHREIGKKFAKRLRRENIVPGIYYKNGEVGIPFCAKALSLRSIIYTSETKIIAFNFEGETEVRKCFMKKVTFDPVSDKPVHVDFVGISDDRKMKVEVPIVLVGVSEGVRLGGVLSQVLHRVSIECLPQHAPNHLAVDISNLQIGKTIHLRDIPHENIDFKIGEDNLVVSVAASRVSQEADKATPGKK
jgi:large subunit ribosomal protein L25